MGPVRDRLESLLSGAGEWPETKEHLSSCGSCLSELKFMREQSALLSALKAPEELEPTTGFYARVMQRIEDHTRDSIWAAIIYSPFGKRLAYASLTAAALMGSYVVAQESRDGHLLGENIVAQQIHYTAPVIGDKAQQRDAVLQNFAVSEGNIQ